MVQERRTIPGVGNGETPDEGQEINVLGGSYQFPDYIRRRQSALVTAFTPPLALAWETTPNSVGSVGSGEEPATGQDINVLGGDYVFPSYVRSSDDASVPVGIFPRRSEVRDAGTRQNGILIPGTKLWGGEYSSVGKFPPGFNGQVIPLTRICFVTCCVSSTDCGLRSALVRGGMECVGAADRRTDDKH